MRFTGVTENPYRAFMLHAMQPISRIRSQRLTWAAFALGRGFATSRPERASTSPRSSPTLVFAKPALCFSGDEVLSVEVAFSGVRLTRPLLDRS